MPLQKSEYSCPICKAASAPLSQIVANAGELQCTNNPAHKWVDTTEFLNLKPTMDFKVSQAPLPQQNYTPYTISIPINLKTALDERFGEKAGPTVASILGQMVEGKVLVVGQTDLDRISAKMGSEPRNSSELYGMIYAKSEEVAEAKMIAENAVKDVKAYEGLSIGRVVCDLGDQLQSAMVKAQDAALPLGAWASKMIQDGLANGWF